MQAPGQRCRSRAFICNFMTSPHAGAPTRPVPTSVSPRWKEPMLRGFSAMGFGRFRAHEGRGVWAREGERGAWMRVSAWCLQHAGVQQGAREGARGGVRPHRAPHPNHGNHAASPCSMRLHAVRLWCPHLPARAHARVHARVRARFCAPPQARSPTQRPTATKATTTPEAVPMQPHARVRGSPGSQHHARKQPYTHRSGPPRSCGSPQGSPGGRAARSKQAPGGQARHRWQVGPHSWPRPWRAWCCAGGGAVCVVGACLRSLCCSNL